MPNAEQSVFTRDDTFFGVCEALGQDFGFNSNILRIVLGISVLVSPVAVIGIYAVLGVIVFVSRTLFPVRGKAARTAEPAAQTVQADNDEHAADYAIAA